MAVEARNNFVNACEGVDTVLGCLEKILHGCPESVLKDYRRRWEDAEKARQERDDG